MIKKVCKKEISVLFVLYLIILKHLIRKQESSFTIYLYCLITSFSTQKEIKSQGTDKKNPDNVKKDFDICGKEPINKSKTANLRNGNYYYNARWYDPNLGRFITEDPIRDGLNYYIYVNNNPVNFIDPTGLEDEKTTSNNFRSFGKDWIRKTSPRVTFPKGSELSPYASKFSMILNIWAEREVFYNADSEIINQIFTGKVLSELSLNFGDKWSVVAASYPDVTYQEGKGPDGDPAYTGLTVKADSLATKSKDIYGAMMDTLKNLAMGPSSGIGIVDDIFTVAGGIDAITDLNSLFGAQGAYSDAMVNFDFSDAALDPVKVPILETGVESTPNSVTVTEKKNEYLAY